MRTGMRAAVVGDDVIVHALIATMQEVVAVGIMTNAGRTARQMKIKPRARMTTALEKMMLHLVVCRSRPDVEMTEAGDTRDLADLAERRVVTSIKCPNWVGRCLKFQRGVLRACIISDDPGGRMLVK